jgi:hypothetical protein
MIPAGRTAVAMKPFIPPAPLFGPGSVSYLERQTEALELAVSEDKDLGGTVASPANGKSYAGEGSYF